MARKEIKENVAHAIYFSKGERPQGREHQVKTAEEKKQHKEHQLKIKARKNAKKGIHIRKISYPKKRGNK